MTAQATKPVWAIVSATLNDGYDGPASAIFRLLFDGEPAAELAVIYGFAKVDGKATTTTCSITFSPGHEGNDGAYITCLALKALYDNQKAMCELTGVADDFEFVSDAFWFLNKPLTFEY